MSAFEGKADIRQIADSQLNKEPGGQLGVEPSLRGSSLIDVKA